MVHCAVKAEKQKITSTNVKYAHPPVLPFQRSWAKLPVHTGWILVICVKFILPGKKIYITTGTKREKLTSNKNSNRKILVSTLTQKISLDLIRPQSSITIIIVILPFSYFLQNSGMCVHVLNCMSLKCKKF